MSTKAVSFGSKRQRVSRACDLCRRKKIKCDGGSPICSNCQAFSLECSYKDTTKKRGPPKGYIEAVESRLQKLESYLRDVAKDSDDPKARMLLEELNSPLETPTGEIIKSRPIRRNNHLSGLSGTLSPTQNESPMSLSQICFADSPPRSGSASGGGGGDIGGESTVPSSPDSPEDDSTGQLSMEENGQVRYLGKSSGYYLLQKSRTYQNGAFHFTGWGHKLSAPERRIAKPLDPYELPPKDLSHHLLNIYFEYFYPSLPLFYKKRLTSSLSSPLEPISPLLLNAIYAVASRVSPDPRVRSDLAAPDTAGEIFFERAKCLLDDYYDVPRISTVQALLLLSMHQHGTMKYVRGWLYSGMAFRMAQDLGLHRNCDHWNVPPDERERRKRVFWCCFIIDRLTSAIYGRTSTFEERDCDVPFPSVDDDLEEGEEQQRQHQAASPDAHQKPRILETFVHFIKICDILGHVLRNVYYAKARHHASSHHLEHVLAGLNRELTNWYNRLPPSLQYRLPDTEAGDMGKAPPLAISQIHMIYYTCVILLHRPFIPGPSVTQNNASSAAASLPSYKICISAAHSILDIINVMLNEKQLRYVYNYAVYCVFTAGIVFIKMASSDDTEKAFDAKVYINKIMGALDEMEMTWMNAARCCNILGELAGLRDINLECDGYVPRRNSKSSLMPAPPAIAVPNSPETSNRQNHQQQQQQQEQQQQQMIHDNVNTMAANHTGSTMDPFAAPGILHSQQYDPFHTAFWGVPPSLDIEEWNNYFGTQQQEQQQQLLPPEHQQQHPQQQQSISSSQSQQPLIPSHEFSPMHHQLRTTPSPFVDSFRQRVTVRSTGSGTLSDAINLPESPASSVLLGFLSNSSQQQGSLSSTREHNNSSSSASTKS
ncbi:fungal-specific transcription factor domain-containing protein [Dichotomocladium elegans]|nr:fungal-specific transcription factor domain-containing protein [Dichotomocladium elegans]